MSKKKEQLGHRFAQVSTDNGFFVAFNILVIRVHPWPQNRSSHIFILRSYIFVINSPQFHYYEILN